MLFNCLAFPKVTTFTCSFDAFDVSVSMLNMSFPGADVRGLGLVKATERAEALPSTSSRQVLCDLFCLSLFPWSSQPDQCGWGLSNRLKNYQASGCIARFTGNLQGLWQARLQKKHRSYREESCFLQYVFNAEKNSEYDSSASVIRLYDSEEREWKQSSSSKWLRDKINEPWWPPSLLWKETEPILQLEG